MSKRALLPCLLLSLMLGLAPAEAGETNVRVLHLQGIETNEAITLLRQQLQIRRIAEMGDLRAIVIGDSEDQLARAEQLLRDRDAIAAASSPHEPISLDRGAGGEIVTRELAIVGVDPKYAVSLLRSIYIIRQITLLDGGLTVTAPTDRVEAAEALLDDLGLLARDG